MTHKFGSGRGWCQRLGCLRCPKCFSRRYYYEGTYILCRDCKHKVRLPDSKIPKDWLVNDATGEGE